MLTVSVPTLPGLPPLPLSNFSMIHAYISDLSAILSSHIADLYSFVHVTRCMQEKTYHDLYMGQAWKILVCVCLHVRLATHESEIALGLLRWCQGVDQHYWDDKISDGLSGC